MNYVFFFLIFASFILSISGGNMDELSSAALTECTNAVTLAISLCGTICFWNGIMKVAEKSGTVSALSKLFSPFLRLLFPAIDKKGKAMSYIVLNFISNLLGLGNASTPLGIKAMNELKSEENADDTATDSMIMLVVLNTASLQFFPATITAIRVKYESAAPTEILPCVWAVSVVVLTVSVLAAKLISRFRLRGKAHKKST